MHKEIETKIRITSNNQFKNLLAWLEHNATFVGHIQQKDLYFDNPNNSFFYLMPQGYQEAMRFLRVRLTDEGDFLCYKNWHTDFVSGDKTHCDEYETKVADGNTVVALLEKLGFDKRITVYKERWVYLVNDFEVSVDEVKDMGIFVEIEIKKNIGCPKQGLLNIKELLKQMGIVEYVEQKGGYACMALNPHHDFGREVKL